MAERSGGAAPHWLAAMPGGAGAGVGRRRGPTRLVVLGLLIAAGCVSYIDRTALAVSTVEIGREFGLSYTDLGLLLSSFATVYMLCQIPAGLVADRVRARRLLLFSLLVWSAAQILSAFSTGMGGLLAARGLLAIGEAPIFLAGTRVIALWFDRGRRAMPIGLFNASSALGQVLAPALLGGIAVQFGWRAMFGVVGCTSLVLAVIWAWVYRDPRTVAAGRGEDAPPPTIAEEIRFLLSHRSSWALAGGFVGVVYLQWLYAAWLPTYLQTARHAAAARADYLSSLPQLAGFLGGLGGGVVSEVLGRIGWPAARACRVPLVAALFVAAAATILAPLCPTMVLSLVAMSVALFAAGIAMTCGWTLGTVLIDDGSIATLEAIQNMGGSLGGAIAPVLTGAITQRTGSFTMAMVVAGLVAALSGIIYWVGTGRRIEA
ncbi:MFS transporter [Gluconacetobacter diazotrophicus]|nr:MFS transporter [Gluconacetobacter diazotrophicus]